MAAAVSGARGATVVQPLAGPAADAVVAGPLVVGSTLVWASQSSGRYVVHARAANGQTSTLLSVPYDPRQENEARLSRAGDWVGFRAYAYHCDADCRGQLFYTDRDERWWGPVTGPQLTPADPCAVAQTADYVIVGDERLVPTGDGPCPPFQWLLRDLRTPAGSPLVLGVRGTVAGDVAVQNQYVDGQATLRVLDWRTGAELYRRAAPSLQPLSLDDAGELLSFTVDYSTSADRLTVSYTSPSQPLPQTVPLPDGILESKVSAGRIAWGGEEHVANHDVIGMTSAGGTPTAVSTLPRLGDFDFSGTTLAWAVQPCGVADLVAWDASGPPAEIPTACGIPVVKVPARVNASRRLKPSDLLVRLGRCPRRPAQGCAGSVAWTRRTKSGGVTFAHSLFAAAPGQDIRLGGLDPTQSFIPLQGPRHVPVTLRIRLAGTQRTHQLTARTVLHLGTRK